MHRSSKFREISTSVNSESKLMQRKLRKIKRNKGANKKTTNKSNVLSRTWIQSTKGSSNRFGTNEGRI